MNRFTRCSIIIQIKLNLYNIVPQRILLLQLWELLYTNYRLSLRLYENLNQILCSYNWKHWIKISFCCIFTSTIRLSFSIQNLQRTRETCMKSWGSTLGKVCFTNVPAVCNLGVCVPSPDRLVPKAIWFGA